MEHQAWQSRRTLVETNPDGIMAPMAFKDFRGLFITGTDTGVGKTYVGGLVARALRRTGHSVGVYKPAASGCRLVDGRLISDDAVALWDAAGRPGALAMVCPQVFAAPLAPHLAAKAEGRTLDPRLLRRGLEVWRGRCDVVLVEGAGGLLSPLGDDESVADLAWDLGFPLLIVARNALGTINHTLQTLVVASVYRGRLDVTGIVLNHPSLLQDDPSVAGNRAELERLARVPVLAEVAYGADRFDAEVDWFALAATAKAGGRP
jgi:dethiobiotin synthetase